MLIAQKIRADRIRGEIVATQTDLDTVQGDFAGEVIQGPLELRWDESNGPGLEAMLPAARVGRTLEPFVPALSTTRRHH